MPGRPPGRRHAIQGDRLVEGNRLHQLQQCTGRFRGVYRAMKARCHQARQVPDVIDVGMRQQDGVEPVRWWGEGLPVLLLHPAPTLE